MRTFAVFIVALVIGFSTSAHAIIADADFVPKDSGAPIPSATVVITVIKPDAPAAAPTAKPARRAARKPGARRVTTSTNRRTGRVTGKIDIDPGDKVTVTVRKGGVTFTSGEIPAERLIGGGDIPMIRVASAPPGDATSPRRFVRPPPPNDPIAGPVVGAGAGSQTTACHDVETKKVETIGVVDPIGDSPTACLSSAFRGSIFLGYSRRLGTNYLVGIEGDIGLTNKSGKVNGIPGTVGGVPGLTAAAAANDSFTLKKTWDASLRGRFGYFINPRTVIYTTGGIAFQHIKATVNCSAAGVCGLGPAPFTASNSTTMTGWTLGGGLEYALSDRFLVRGEYRYADYGTYTATFGTAANAAFTSDIRLRTHTFLIGIGFQFGDTR